MNFPIVLKTGDTAGTLNPRSKLTDASVLEIRRRYRLKPETITQKAFAKAIAVELQVGWQAVVSVIQGTTWRWLKEPVEEGNESA